MKKSTLPMCKPWEIIYCLWLIGKRNIYRFSVKQNFYLKNKATLISALKHKIFYNLVRQQMVFWFFNKQKCIRIHWNELNTRQLVRITFTPRHNDISLPIAWAYCFALWSKPYTHILYCIEINSTGKPDIYLLNILFKKF